MKEGILVDSEPCGGGGNKTQKGKMVNGDFVVGAPTNVLADITNLQQDHLKPSNQHAKKQPASPAAYNCADQLLKENAMLMKHLASRNAVLESAKAELQKLQSNFQKLRTQNVELAQANSQMLAELNSSRQRMRELQLELGCKNGILKAMKLKSKGKEHTAKLKCKVSANEIQQAVQTFQEDNPGNAKRRRMSKSQTSEPAVIRQHDFTENVDNQGYCLRRQSMGFESEKPGPTGGFFEADDTKSCISHLEENLEKRKASKSSGAIVQEETRKDTRSSGPSTIKQVRAKENIDKISRSLRRQSARFKPEVPEPSEETKEVTKYSELRNMEQVHAKQIIDKRRKSASSKQEDSEPTEDLFKIDDPKFAVANAVKTGSPTTSSVTFGQQNKEENSSFKFDPQEVRRSSVGRPMRRAVEKVQTYKEIPVNLKMRRPN